MWFSCPVGWYKGSSQLVPGEHQGGEGVRGKCHRQDSDQDESCSSVQWTEVGFLIIYTRKVGGQ